MKAEYIDHLGTDLTVVNSARVSFDKESVYIQKGSFSDVTREVLYEQFLTDSDKGLLSYLARHNHWTPFSHPQITMRETVPIFVARQRFKHVVGFTYNEVSRRYVDDEPEFYVPDTWRTRPEGSVKQGSGSDTVEFLALDGIGTVKPTQEVYNWHIQDSLDLYKDLLEQGVAPEQARMVLPQSMMTSYYVTGSLAAWARAYKQRIDAHAQVEIQDLAKQWDDIIRPLYPESWAVLTKERE